MCIVWAVAATLVLGRWAKHVTCMLRAALMRSPAVGSKLWCGACEDCYVLTVFWFCLTTWRVSLMTSCFPNDAAC